MTNTNDLCVKITLLLSDVRRIEKGEKPIFYAPKEEMSVMEMYHDVANNAIKVTDKIHDKMEEVISIFNDAIKDLKQDDTIH